MGIHKYSLSVLNSPESLFCQKSPREWRVDDSSRLLDARRRLEHDEKTMTLSPVEMESHSSIGEGSAKIFRPAKFRIVRLRS